MRRIIALLFLILAFSARAETDAPTLLYMGQASLRVVSAEGRVICIDPDAGEATTCPLTSSSLPTATSTTARWTGCGTGTRIA